MPKSQPEIITGARGWQFDQWHGSFYPEDLPDEWRFSYYSNEFRSVLVPSDYFEIYTVDDWVDWADDTHDNFSFYIEINAKFSWEQVYERIDVLTKQIEGFILVLSHGFDKDQTDRLVHEAAAIAPVCAMEDDTSKGENQKFKAFLEQHKLNQVWHGKMEKPDWAYHGAAIACRTDSDDNSPLVLRDFMEKSLQHAGEHKSITIFFTGESPKLEEVRSAQTIADLLA